MNLHNKQGFEMSSFFTHTNNQQSPKNASGLLSNLLGDANIANMGNPILMSDNSKNLNAEYSPENTQYTILKAKLFNPNIREEGTTITNKVNKPNDGVSGSNGKNSPRLGS